MRARKVAREWPDDSRAKKTIIEIVAAGTTIIVGVCKIVESYYSAAGQAFFQSVMEVFGIT
jgi:hypothetical protein